MIRGYAVDQGRLRLVDDPIAEIASVIWLDLLTPTQEEEQALERTLGVDVPTREEMEEIEVSSRLYKENGAVFMTATVPARADSEDLVTGAITFVLVGDKLVTVRYHEPRAFRVFPHRAERVDLGCTDGVAVLTALLEAIVDRLADVLERVQRDVDGISQEIFKKGQSPNRPRPSLNDVIIQLGRKGDVGSVVRDSLGSLYRVVSFFAQSVDGRTHNNKELRGRVKMLARDVQSLADHVEFLSQKVTFLLDATLGMITIEQSNIIKIFSVLAGVFLPPTLIASIYGMNFRVMPELDWWLGYPLACVLMLSSAVLPYWYFKRRGWL